MMRMMLFFSKDGSILSSIELFEFLRDMKDSGVNFFKKTFSELFYINNII